MDLRKSIFLLLWLMVLLVFLWMKRHGYRFKSDWNWSAVRAENLRPMLKRLALSIPALLLFTLWVSPERFFSMPRERPLLWLLVLLFYPPLSALPQELVYRSFLFRRYANLFSARAINIPSALSFGWAHIALQNWVAMVLGTVGGYFFADTYGRTRSLAMICLEHSLYGCAIFTIGLGRYFYRM